MHLGSIGIEIQITSIAVEIKLDMVESEGLRCVHKLQNTVGAENVSFMKKRISNFSSEGR
jgi:hypothetical protein